jgi:hypothetical protein
MAIRIIKHEAVPQTGSFEVRYDDGQHRPGISILKTFRAVGSEANK